MKVHITDDFDLKKIQDSGQCFRVRETGNGIWRFIHLDRILYISRTGESEYEVSAGEDEWREIWQPYFDLDRSYESIRQAIPEEDAFLKRASEYGKGIRILKQDPWEMLVTFIISQRKNIPAISKSVELLCERFGRRADTEEELFFFPDSEEMSGADEEALRECKLGYRAPYVLDAVNKVRSGEIDLCKLNEYDDRKLFEALKTINGVGDKVANCICLFAYGRTALVPVDTWIARVIETEYNGQSPFDRYGGAGGILQQWAFYYARETG
ncbi:MAG TPA: 8-oxoguanine DNA glycosylase [Lachnospiraceae bacterium]|nr:8-oxoguanine DNA glycosylase [Lachnospiraceae bacterium]